MKCDTGRPHGLRGVRSARSPLGLGVRLASLSAAFVLLLLVVGAVSASAATYQRSDVSTKIMCLCGCNAVLEECPHQDCSWGIPAKNLITERLGQGQKPDEIIKYFVATYGEKVLAAPTKTGFNVIAWVTPFLVLIVGAAAVFLVARTWSRRRGDDLDVAVVATAPVDTAPTEEYVRRLDDELKDFD
jgi:cytochrome c-type biogenesis protein CcmH